MKNAQQINGGEKTRRNLKTPLISTYKKLIIFFSLLLLFFLSFQCSQQRKVLLHYLDGDQIEHVLTLSQKDRKLLLGLMEKLFAEDSFAYTLLGSKPISWASYKIPFSFVNWSIFLDSLKKIIALCI